MTTIDGSQKLAYPVSWDYMPLLLQQEIGPVEADFTSFHVMHLRDAPGIEVYRELEASDLIKKALTVPVLHYFREHPEQIPAEYPEGTRLFFLGNLFKDENIDRRSGWDPSYPLGEAWVPFLKFGPEYEGGAARWHMGIAIKLTKHFTEHDVALFLKAETA